MGYLARLAEGLSGSGVITTRLSVISRAICILGDCAFAQSEKMRDYSKLLFFGTPLAL
jgi:hypothetical protein